MAARLLSCSLLVLLLCACCRYSAAQDIDDVTEPEEDTVYEAERAFLLVRKFVKDTEISKGANTTVTIEIYNAGNSAAQDVILSEAAWPSKTFKVDPASYDNSYERIASGATVKHTYDIQALEGPQYVRTEPAQVIYKPEYGSQDVQRTNSPIVHLLVVTFWMKYGRAALRLGMWATGGAMRTPGQWLKSLWTFAVIVIVGTGSWLYRFVTDTNKKRQYKKALREVETY